MPAGPYTVFSGIQSSGVPHVGNYIGAIQTWVRMQRDAHARLLFSVVDWHSITVPQDPAALRRHSRSAVILLLASGLDPRCCVLFQQSAVPEHTELAWILGCLTSTGALNRMTQWKSKAQKQEVPCLGLYTYPVLMAADILLYKATHVPVGDDQDQHLELTRDLAAIFNTRFGEGFFPLPQAIYSTAPRVLDLRNPTDKMSKSARSDMSRINLSDDPDLIRHKILKAVTDNISEVYYDVTARPAVSNLITMYANLTPQPLSVSEVERQFRGQTTHQFKMALGDLVVQALLPVQSETRRLEADEGYVTQVLREGADKARALAADTMKHVRHVVGLAGH